MGKKETEAEKRRRLALESIERLKAAVGPMKRIPSPDLSGIDKKGSDGEYKSPFGTSSQMGRMSDDGTTPKSKRTASDDTVDGIMSIWKKKRK